MSLSRTEKLSQRHLIFFNEPDDVITFFDNYGTEVSIQEIKEILGMIAVIYTDMEEV